MWILAEYRDEALAAVPVSEGHTVRGLSAPPQQQQQQQQQQEKQQQQPRQPVEERPSPGATSIEDAHDSASLEREGALARRPSIEEPDEQPATGQLNSQTHTGTNAPTAVTPSNKRAPPASITVAPAEPSSTATRTQDLKELLSDKKEKLADKKEKLANKKEKLTDKKDKIKDKVKPPGGFDRTPFPDVSEPGWTVRFVFHRAANLPVADFHNRSADPFILSTLSYNLPRRHEEDPPLTHRTPTIHRTIEPQWEDEWVVANVPTTGFRLKCRLYDEDFPDKNDRLGNVTVEVPHVDDAWVGFQNAEFEVKKRTGSKRAYLLKGVTSAWQHGGMTPRLHLTIQVVGRSDSVPRAQVYTLGPTTWAKHYSPLFGRLLGIKVNKDEDEDARSSEHPQDKKYQKYDFQANEMQLSGPVPPELYHRYVEFTPLIGKLFTAKGIRGHILNKALHKQHNRIYNFNRSTEYGTFARESEEAALQFLRMCHFDDGHRIFTYVLTLDGLLRFTETGTEFGIDLLSKHTMHSDAATYVACSGEFFVRRVRPRASGGGGGHSSSSIPSASRFGGSGSGEPASPASPVSPHQQHQQQERRRRPASAEAAPASHLQVLAAPQSPAPVEVGRYQLVIDNDSGTYRPNPSVLPLLGEFLQRNFPGLHVRAMHWEDERLQAMKRAQRERKKQSGLLQARLTTQDRSADSSSISLSEESRLEEMERAGGEGGAENEQTAAAVAAVDARLKSKRERMFEAVADPHGVHWRDFLPKRGKGNPAGGSAEGKQTGAGDMVMGETGDGTIEPDDDVDAALATKAGAASTSGGVKEPSSKGLEREAPAQQSGE